MGDKHGNQWMRALPWVLLGKRVQVQPDLDVSSAELVYGKTLDLPGHFLSHPGAPLTNVQTKMLVEQLYKMSARPAMQTSSAVNPLDISYTEKATHVYVKRENPLGLTPLFEGPYKIVSRPSRTTVEVRVGSYVNGQPRLQVYNWSLCKIAHLRSEDEVAERPNLGRRPGPHPDPPKVEYKLKSDSAVNNTVESNMASDDATGSQPVEVTEEPAKIQTEPNYSVRNTRSTRNKSPNYVV